MSCEHPLLAVNFGLDASTGKNRIKILPQRADYNLKMLEEKYGHRNLLLLPCGSCPSCKVSHQKQWAVRCALESLDHKESCMVTLTYDDEHCPKKLIKRDLQKFIKDLRNRGYKFRYFGCGEYGSHPTSGQFGRPHYHIILFGLWFDDCKYLYDSKSGYPIYSSKIVESVWKKGIVTVSEMTNGTAAYVAGYVDKKLGQDEFSLMSKRPGIGEKYFRLHLLDIYRYDNIVVPGSGVSKVPRYCDKIADSMMFDLDEIKEKRFDAVDGNVIQVMMVHSMDYKEQVYDYNGRIMRDKISRRKRL